MDRSTQREVYHGTRQVPPRSTNNVLIAVMGATGSGKSSFINLAAGSTLQVGNGLLSCTDRVEVAPFELDGRMVTLIDTPGFDDTNMSDTEILNMIALFLASLYEQDQRLHGILYLHRISDFRMGGGSRRNFNMFRHLCGTDCLPNVVIVTNMWEQVAVETGNARAQELANDELFFKLALDHGAKMISHDRTTDSAQAIVREVFRNPPMILRIQTELVIEKKNITETAAGIALDEELAEQRKKYVEELEELQKETEEASRTHDAQAVEELTKAREELSNNLSKVDQERGRLVSDYARGRDALHAEMESLQRELQRERTETARTAEEIYRMRRAVEQQKRGIRELRQETHHIQRHGRARDGRARDGHVRNGHVQDGRAREGYAEEGHARENFVVVVLNVVLEIAYEAKRFAARLRG
ncbi:hypothetical protein QCA50_014601 [Cerrena zonata]|uniref:G domain-containing protein n=1 Tax=Cerrena zonata TaxID=2478898 RepID=A0AAW0FYF2_9APHY